MKALLVLVLLSGCAIQPLKGTKPEVTFTSASGCEKFILGAKIKFLKCF